MTITRASAKAKGRNFEHDAVIFAQDHGFPDAYRLARTGAKDQGDVWLPVAEGGIGHLLECKNEANLALAGWVGEAQAEAVNATEAGKSVLSFAVLHKRRGRTDMFDQYVTLPYGVFLALLTQGRSLKAA